MRDKELAIKKKIEQYEHTRALHRQSRSRQGLQTVGIVGYTNAGKSRLMNALTHKDILVENKLFATLGTSVGKMYVAPSAERLQRGNDESKEENNGQDGYEHTGRGKEILINDTIGFIRDLPPDLIEAFSSTLEDSIHSDLLLHVVDASDAHIDEKIEVVDSILTKIGATQTKLYVFNKIDLISDSQQENLRKKYEYLRPIFISAER
ncbi:50S ribosome-binding GTPase [Patescibacteria group bacterium]|nr:50S ribosome-binding GTPase [Patescibacteria group bacterium]